MPRGDQAHSQMNGPGLESILTGAEWSEHPFVNSVVAENMLRAWMTDNKTKQWSMGLNFVQWQKNISFHRILNRSPYTALFGSEPKMGLGSTNIPSSILAKLTTEEDLENLQNKGNEERKRSRDSNEPEPSDAPVEKAARLEDDINDVPCCNCQTGGKTEQCSTCPNVCHAQCGQTTLEDGQTSLTFLCNLCQNEIVIRQTRSETHERQKDAAAGMAESSEKLFDDLQIEDKVILAVPKVDRGPLDHQNVQGFVTDIRNGVYQVGTIGGIIKNWCARPDLRRIDYVDFDFSQIPREKFISIREAVAAGSMFGGQDVMKCSCKPSKKQCGTRRCLLSVLQEQRQNAPQDATISLVAPTNDFAIIPKNRVTCAESDEYVDVPSYTGTEENEFECTSQHHGMGWNDRLPRTDATIRADLIRNGIIPEFIIKPPKYEAFITFHGSVEPDMGNLLRPEQVRWAPHAIEFKFKPNSYYCIVMTGLDEPSKAVPTKREFLHWIVGNMPEDNLAIAEHIAEYYPVLPKKDTGLHRYLLLVYEQKMKIDFKEFRLTCRNDWGRAKWSSRKFADKYKLGEPYAVNFFYSEHTAT